jgi:hypothetical protein
LTESEKPTNIGNNESEAIDILQSAEKVEKEEEDDEKTLS